MERGPGVGIGDVHVREGEAIEEGAIVVADIVKDHPFALVEAVAEGPLLPLNDLASFSSWRYSKTCSLGLYYIKRLDVGS